MHACLYLSYELCFFLPSSTYKTVLLKRYATHVLIFFFMILFCEKMFLIELCSSSSCTRWLSGFLNFVCMLPLVHNTFGYLSLAVLRSCYSADVHAPCSHSLTLLPCSSNRWFPCGWFAMAAEQKLVRRWSETRLFFRIAHCLRLLSLRV